MVCDACYVCMFALWHATCEYIGVHVPGTSEAVVVCCVMNVYTWHVLIHCDCMDLMRSGYHMLMFEAPAQHTCGDGM